MESSLGKFFFNIWKSSSILGKIVHLVHIRRKTFRLQCQIALVPNCPLLHYGAKLSMVPNCPRCQIVHFWPAVPNCPRCQIVHFTLRCQIVLVPNCPLLHCGAKLSANMGGAKLSTVPNCPRCQIVLGPDAAHITAGVQTKLFCSRDILSVSSYSLTELFTLANRKMLSKMVKVVRNCQSCQKLSKLSDIFTLDKKL